MGVLGAQLFLNDGKIGYVTAIHSLGRALCWERAFNQYRGTYSAQQVLAPPLSGSPCPSWQQMVPDINPGGPVAFMSAEILTAFGTQLPAPGAAKWEAKEEVGKSCGSPGKAH